MYVKNIEMNRTELNIK